MFIVPQSKFITPNMLERHFYDNHTFYQCEYDESIYISLSGRVLQLLDNQFKTFLGYSKEMKFNMLDTSKRELDNQSIDVVYIDNVINELAYTTSSSTSKAMSKKDSLKRAKTKEDYLSLSNNLAKKYPELREIEFTLIELIERLQNNYILMKNHVLTFTKYFQELGTEFRQVY